MATPSPLDVIQIDRPCDAAWDAMPGDDRRRFCAHCQKHVFNLAAMPRDEAERLVCESAGSLCARVQRDAAGTVVTLDYARTERRPTWFWLMIGGGSAMTLALAGAIYAARQPPPARPPVVLGGMRCPVPATGTSSTDSPAPAPETPAP